METEASSGPLAGDRRTCAVGSCPSRAGTGVTVVADTGIEGKDLPMEEIKDTDADTDMMKRTFDDKLLQEV